VGGDGVPADLVRRLARQLLADDTRMLADATAGA
jgi:hypothetical protein